ncbi:P-loop containing nucleoside triphosphate hydrolase protein [Dipodascopsis uninucleata]
MLNLNPSVALFHQSLVLATSFLSARSWRYALPTISAVRQYANSSSAAKYEAECKLENIRTIGIIAHIDAGKTTTTERMLYLSGYTGRIGNVDEGDTVMDYLPAERNRGITITSAAISFDWNGNRINLIDTPGHADFTFEVIRSIRVLDGAVTILDGVEGVEAQTEKVWQQASESGIPRIVFVNKMDREGAGFGRTIREIAGKLAVKPVIVNMPYFRKDVTETSTNTVFSGVVDVLNMKLIEWIPGKDGKDISVRDLESDMLEEAKRARIALVETLSELDDVLVEKFLEAEDHMALSSNDIKDSLRRCTLQNTVVPVLCGASFRNIGVQPLLDAIVDYLPSPNDRPVPVLRSVDTAISLSDCRIGCALAFKVIHDSHSNGILVFVRVYSGTLKRNAKILNTSNQIQEKVHRISRMYADRSVDIDSIEQGHIGVISGSQHVRTGDTILFNLDHMSPAAKKLGKNLRAMQLNPIRVPSPVFFSSIEPASLSEARSLEMALATLLREDPSLQVTVDEETGQTHLSGMGELHLEIARDRLINDLKIKAHIGKIQISYRESIEDTFFSATPSSYTYKQIVKGAEFPATVAVILRPIPEDLEYVDDKDFLREIKNGIPLNDGNILTIRARRTHQRIPQEEIVSAIKFGAQAGLYHGKRYGLPMQSVQVIVTDIQLSSDQENSSPLTPSIRFAIVQFMDSIPMDSKVLMEPMMDVTIILDEEDLGNVISDISSARSGRVYALDDQVPAQNDGDTNGVVDADKIYCPPDHTLHLSKHNIRRSLYKRLVKAKVPLSEMVGYLKHLRSLTQGRGSFIMNFDRYERMSKDRATTVWKKFYS